MCHAAKSGGRSSCGSGAGESSEGSAGAAAERSSGRDDELSEQDGRREKRAQRQVRVLSRPAGLQSYKLFLIELSNRRS